jgi:dienelactone hydrolase
VDATVLQEDHDRREEGLPRMASCGGPPGHQEWIGRLNGWGYATYYIDSFRPRHLKNVCAEQQFKGFERVGDAYAALAYLRTRSDTRADRIGLIGFSHGGAAAYTARADVRARRGCRRSPPRSRSTAGAAARNSSCHGSVDPER